MKGSGDSGAQSFDARHVSRTRAAWRARFQGRRIGSYAAVRRPPFFRPRTPPEMRHTLALVPKREVSSSRLDRERRVRVRFRFLAAVSILVVTGVPMFAQAPKPAAAAKSWVQPKTPWGDPDLQGTWT